MSDINIKIKFMLFAGTTFYPSGGWEDFKGYFNTVPEAIAYLCKNHKQLDLDVACDPWFHIVENDEIICAGKMITINALRKSVKWNIEYK